MNFEEVVKESGGLRQDEWSMLCLTFGEQNQLKVVGWSGRVTTNKYGHKFYIVYCSICSKDAELFGDGYFRSQKKHLVSGTVPCGCSYKYRWSKNQYSVLCRRRAEEMGFNFLDFSKESVTLNTKIKLLCKDHGMWRSNTVGNLLHHSCGCPECRLDKIRVAKKKPDDIMISSFLSTGAFSEGTLFSRTKRKTKQGQGIYWEVLCPDCGTTGESTSGNLQSGQRPCACSGLTQREAYISYIMDNNQCLAIKFGVTNRAGGRNKEQNRGCVYDVVLKEVWEFPSTEKCRRAEKACYNLLDRGILLKDEMPDGYTETTYPRNLDTIRYLYKKYGGIRTQKY